MDSVELYLALSKDAVTREQFCGVYPADILLEVKAERPCLMVVNTDESDGDGLHWIVFYLPSVGPAEFFDPLGSRPEMYKGYFQSFLMTKGPSYIHNTIRLQDIGTNTCGFYCLYYAYLRCRGWTMENVIDSLTNRDKDIIQSVERFYNLKFSESI